MDIAELVEKLEGQGVIVTLIEGDRVRLRASAEQAPSQEILESLRSERRALLAYLRARHTIPAKPEPARRQAWPPESIDYEQRFGQPHAKLFPFIGRKVLTPAGPGTLLQVFRDTVTVVLDSEVKNCARFAPGEVEPASWLLD